MPKQNRVTPTGAIIATPARGTLMGNRGCLHDAQQTIRRDYQLKRWIICVLDFKQRHRQIMRTGYYTELFFLDEATALAAGHRPCAECQRSRFEEFRRLWAAANPALAGSAKPTAVALDAVLHEERLTSNRRKATYSAPLASLPDGSFILKPNDPNPYLVLKQTLLLWQAFGYGQPESFPAATNLEVKVLTPPSVVQTLKQGYRVVLHPSAYLGQVE
jgi:hypothetical protein